MSKVDVFVTVSALLLSQTAIAVPYITPPPPLIKERKNDLIGIVMAWKLVVTALLDQGQPEAIWKQVTFDYRLQLSHYLAILEMVSVVWVPS